MLIIRNDKTDYNKCFRAECKCGCQFEASEGELEDDGFHLSTFCPICARLISSDNFIEIDYC